MKMQLCPNSHYYDALQYSECPYCKSSNVGATVPVFNNDVNPNIGATVPVFNNDANPNIGATVPVFSQPAVSASSDDATKPVMQKKIGADPVVGWLVCIEGKDIGQDYRIHADYNTIGRSASMDISIKGDDTISRENHATIGYDTIENIFIFGKSQGRGIVRVNGKAVMSEIILNPYDKIEIGTSKFMFVPFCDENFQWNK